MMLDYFQNLVDGLEERLKADHLDNRARKVFALETARLGTRLFTPEQSVAWCGVLTPFDLLNAMGVTSCFVEFVGAMLAGTGGVEPMLELAEQNGFATDSCSYHRSVCGATEQGLMPEPDFLIATSAPCAGGMAVLEFLAQRFEKDMFVLQIPQDQNKAAIAYLADQYRDMVSFVTAHTGRKLSTDDLRSAMEKTNQARSLWLQLNQLLCATPSPARPRDLMNLGIVLSLFLGTDGATGVIQAYLDEFSPRVAQGLGGQERETVRLMWLQNRIQFKNPLAQMIEQDFGAAIVLEELNDLNWPAIDLDDPYAGMAARTLSIPLTGSAQTRIDNLKRMARKYKIDGAINPCQWGCRQGTGSRGLIQQGLNEAGIPVQNLEVDCVDPRQFSEGQLRTRLEAFLEMLVEQKSN